MRRVRQVPAQPGPVPLLEPALREAARDAAVPQRVQVHRPAVVIVEVPGAAVGVPAVALVPVLGTADRVVDVRLVPRPADRARERRGDGTEPDPVVVGNPGPGELGEPVEHPRPHRVVQPVPDPRPGLVQRYRDRRGLNLRLVNLVEPRPAARRRRVSAGRDAGRVPVGQSVRVVAARARQPEGREQERAGETLNAVAPRPGATVRSRQADQRVARARVRPHGEQHPVRRRLPVGPRPSGIGRQPRVSGMSVVTHHKRRLRPPGHATLCHRI